MCSSSHHPLIPQQLLSMAALRTFRSAFTCTDIEVSTSSNAAESPSVRLCQFPHVPGHHSIRNVFVGCRMFRGRGPELPFRRFAQTAKQNLACTGSQPSEAPWRLFCTTNSRFHSHTAAAAAQACAQPCRGHIEAIVGATQTRFAYACSNQRSARHAVIKAFSLSLVI